ncbi:MAG TPA: MotA/TolQ/ExbB proton channel family protein [Gemmatimonadales bacterium]|nr:MotA/TolQ/ExbB proton channel family protein [Gemmatimonadales bacterium]
MQIGGAVPTTSWELITSASFETKMVLAVLAVFSALSWVLIVAKLVQFRRLRRAADRFYGAVEHAGRLDEARDAVAILPPSPYKRLFNEGLAFYEELVPGGVAVAASESKRLLPAQLEALRMVLETQVDAEHDQLGRWIPWLATLASASPLLGLLGTVLGVMDSFIGIATSGSGNLAAVAPGVAEALVTTVLGLVVAIPAVIAYNIFTSRQNFVSAELEGFAREFIVTLAREGRV